MTEPLWGLDALNVNPQAPGSVAEGREIFPPDSRADPPPKLNCLASVRALGKLRGFL